MASLASARAERHSHYLFVLGFALHFFRLGPFVLGFAFTSPGWDSGVCSRLLVWWA
jgi:hypothetical protein